MRAVLLALALAAAACGAGTSADEASGGGAPGDDDGLGGGMAPEASCQVADDCVAVASTCCECPSFAVPIGSDYADACDAVECPPPGDCPALEATCGAAGCELVCAPVVATLECPGGFARDEAGCLLDACAATPDAEAPGCEVAEDCVRVAADCCGCARGGEDTAVPADQVAAHEDALGCTGAESCPGVDACEPGVEPACVAGQCALIPTSPGDGGAPTYCGTPEYPACPEGTTCVLNGDPSADALGIGHCQLP